MPKRILRSVIDFQDGKTTAENLSVNFRRLQVADFEWSRPADQKLFNYLMTFFQDRLELPTAQTVHDFFNGAGDTEVLERLKDVKAAPSYVQMNFSYLLQTQVETQNRIKMGVVVKETEEILTKGLIIQDGREKIRLQGIHDAFQYFTQKAHELMPDDINVKSRGDIRADTEASWQEYQDAKHKKGSAYGAMLGVNHIDKVIKGLKAGELWVHAAYAGELKCLPGDAWVFDHKTHRRRTLKDLYETRDLPIVTALANGGATFRLVEAQTSHLEQNGEREVFDLTLASGRTIGASDNHKFFTPTGWKELRELEVGSWVAVPRRVVVRDTGTPLFTDSDVRVLGYLLGDGHLGPSNLTFTASNGEIREDFKQCLLELGHVEGSADFDQPTFRENFREDRAPSVVISHSTGQGCTNPAASPVRLLLDCLGLWGCSSEDKHIPDEIFGLPDRQVRLFLGALWSTDGSCHTGDHERPDRLSLCKRNDITYGSKSHRLCLGIQSLLLRGGIQSTVLPVDTTYKGEPYKFWVVRVVGRQSKANFASLILVVGKEDKFRHLAERLRLMGDMNDGKTIPSSFLPDDRKVPMPQGYFRYSRSVKKRPTVTLEEARKFWLLGDSQLEEAIHGDLDWERVEVIKRRGIEMTYDLSVPNHHTFVANDIVTHNTMFATNWAYQLVTRYRTHVVYYTLEVPYAQIRRIMTALHSAHPKFKAAGYIPLDYRKVRDAELSDEEEAFYQLVLKDWGECPDYCHFEIIAPPEDMTIADIRLDAELLHKQFEVGMIFIDHSELAKQDSKDSSYTVRLNAVIKDAKKKLALQFNGGEGVPVCLLHQINREGRDWAAKHDGRYKMKALSYSHECERSADVITTTFLDEKHREEGTSMCCNLKSRDNPWFDPFLLNVDFECRRVHNMDPVSSSDIGADEPDLALEAAMNQL